MTTASCTGVLGILGGMGPHASAEFLRTVYEMADERHSPAVEQDHIRCLLDSDPSFPDRTEVVRTGREREFTDHLSDRIRCLLDHGASRVVVTCVTAHHFFGGLEPELRAKVISLVEVILDDLELVDDGPFLMLATEGTRQAGIFEAAARWPSVAHRVVMPPQDTQAQIHQLLYRLKREPVTAELSRKVERLAGRHRCTGVIAGCTEAHLLTKWWQALSCGPFVIDPLRSIAGDLGKLV
jgi:aspartate racemase